MKKRNMTALVLAGIMALSTTGTALASVRFADSPSLYSASAAETGAKEVASADDLKAALEAGGAVKLTGDIPMAKKYDISITEDVVLDLNGHTITKSYGEINHFIFVINGGSLVIEDSKGGGKIEATDASYGYGIQLEGTGSSFELKGGTIQTTQETVDIYDTAQNPSIKISGGSLISTADNVLGVRGKGTEVDITGGDMVSNGRTGVYISCYGEPDSIQFNMTGGTLTFTGGASGAIQLYKGATVTIGGTAEIQSSSYVVQAQENTILNVEGGKLSTSGSYVVSGAETSSINISGGELSGRYGVYVEDTAAVKISGGTFEVTSQVISIPTYGDPDPSIEITGGDFNDKDVSNYLPQNPDGSKSIDQPTVEIIASGDTLTANAEHPLKEATFTYQWYKDGSELNAETSKELTVDGYALYKVEVKAEYHGIPSELATAVYDHKETPVDPPKPDTPDEEDRPSREYSDYYGNEKWDEVKREIAKLIEDGKSGETIEMSAAGLLYFPSSVARALKGQDITLEVRKNGVTYSVNGLEIGSIDKIWYEFENLETELLTAGEEKDETSSQSTDEDKTNPDTGR